MGRSAGADNADRMLIARLQFPPDIEHDRRRMNFSQRFRVRFRCLRDHVHAEIANPTVGVFGLAPGDYYLVALSGPFGLSSANAFSTPADTTLIIRSR